ncbi:MAG TPA: tetratricopeptide repeat protein, partial [Polyangiales bacterium]
LELDPDDATALSHLDALYQTTGNADELLSVLEREAELSGDPMHAIDFRYRIGELYELKLNDAFRAVEVYRDILDVLPDHAATLSALERMIGKGQEAVSAATVLEPIYRAAADSGRLARALEVLVEHEEDPIRKVELLHQVAEIYEVHLDDPRRAFDAFARAFPVDSQNDVTLQSLDRLADKVSLWNELSALFDKGIAQHREDSPEITVDLALRAAHIFETRSADVAGAIERYRIVTEIEPEHLQALEALERLYEGTQNWAELASVLERKVAVAASPDEILAIQFKLGQFQQHRLGDVDKAVAHYREILAAAPEHEEALQALEGLFAQGALPGPIAEILEPLYRMQEAWDRLIGVHEVALRAQRDKDERVLSMQRIAEIAEERANDRESAFTWMQRALLEDAENDHTLSEVERLASAVSGYDVLANTYATVAGTQTLPAPQRTAAAKRLARVYAEELNDIDRAEQSYRYALGLAPTDEEVLSALDTIYSQHGSAEALAEVLRKRVAATSDRDDKVELSHRLGQVLWNDCRRVDE